MSPHCVIPAQVTALYVFAVINLTILLNLSLVEADVIATNVYNQTIYEAPDRRALFGPPIPDGGVWAHLIYLTTDGCTTESVEPAPKNGTARWMAMVKRGGCEFEKKVYNAEKAGYVAAIVHNVGSNDLETMGRGTQAYTITIPSVFIGEYDAVRFKRYERSLNYTLELTGYSFPPFSPTLYLVPFIIVVGICFIMMLSFLVVRWVRDLRRRNRSRLSLAHLKKIPVKKFKKGDDYDVCAICLDEYEEGDKMRILPCSHAYHQKCIDPWLTKNKKFCPICKRKVIPGDDTTDSEEESEEEGGHSENTPLLGATASTNRTPGARGGGTFDNSGLPASMRNEVHPLAYDDSDSEDSYTMSTSNYQSSVEVHQANGQPTTVVTMADETRSVDSLETESADSGDEDDDAASRSRTLLGAEGGVDNPAFSVVDNHFGEKVGCINGDEDSLSKSSLDEYKPLMEEDVVVNLPPEASPIESSIHRDQIV